MPQQRKKTLRSYDKIDNFDRLTLDVGHAHFSTEHVVNEENGDESVFTRVRPSQIISLTSYTTAELDALEKFWAETIAMARPIVTALDAEAQDAADNGDHSYRRLYRPDPRYIDFREVERKLKER